ncbi:MAG TPA: hypothetical protein VGS79_17760 [Puia sp.]|nr:hypothetical protein [Puia sp.]
MSSRGQHPLPLEQEHHHKVVLQNAYIRILDGLVAIHDTTPMHVHAANSVVVFLSHSRFGIRTAGGTPVITDVEPGDLRYADYGDKPVTHIVWDEGPEDLHFFVVELNKRDSIANACSSLSQPGLTLQWRKGRVTAYRWDIPPGRHCSLPAGDCAFVLIGLAAEKAGGKHPFTFFPPNHPLSINGHTHEDAQYILLQLR